MSIKKKIFIPMITLTIACGIAVFLTSILLYNRGLNNSIDILFFILIGILVTLFILAVCIVIARHISKIIDVELIKAQEHMAAAHSELVRVNNVNELQLVKLNTVIKAAKIALWDAEINLDNPMDPNTPVLWTDEFKGMIGYTNADDFPNVFTSWINCLHPDDMEKTLQAFAAHLLDTTGKTPFNTEYRLRKKNGQYAYFLAAGSSIRNEDGAAIRVAGALLDISEMKNLQINLENERATLQTMFDSIPDLLYTKDLDLRFKYVNRAMLDNYSLRSEDVTGKKEDEIWPPGTLDKDYDVFNIKVINEGQMIIKEEPIQHADGSFRLYETIRLPIMVDGVITSVLGMARDITERKAMEEAAQSANKSKTVFLANMSHEIRTPMNSIIGFSELAQADEISDKTRGYLSDIQESAEWLLKIINDILDISKIESGKIEFENIPFDLPDIFAYCQSAIMPKITEKGITLYCYAEPSVGKKLLGDPVRLRQIIMNLLSNAVKFTNSGTVKFLASIVSGSEDSVTVRFEIKDSGIGMTPEQINRIFNPFTQADESITRRFGGTGLGLTITKNIVDLMGGTLNVESTPSVGSRFSFDLTFGLINDTDLPKREIILNDFEKPNFKGEVLVCEDNNLNQKVICDHLERVGLKTVVAHNGKEGLDIISKRIKNNKIPFDLIFMDIHMPVMDGLDAAQKITAMGVKTPIVAITANIMSNDIELYKTSGMYDTIGKPFTTQDLWKCLAKYIPIESYTIIDKKRAAAEENKMRKMIKTNFVKYNQTTYDDIVSAIDSGDIKLAHRLAHTLKSNAGQIGKKPLQTAAAKVESALAQSAHAQSARVDEKAKLDDKDMRILKTELDSVLCELAPLLNDVKEVNKSFDFDMEKALKLFERLEPLLRRNNTECLEFIDDLYDIPKTEELITQIERYKFDDALTSLYNLRKDMVSGNE
ncbi:MAG: ATP-binding protein [Treponema sp.]|nr:ATP-binding protein [Treponema sp.]